MIRLEDVLTDEEIRDAYLKAPTKLGIQGGVRACIALAVEKAEKVEGFVVSSRIPEFKSNGCVMPGNKSPEPSEPNAMRHALLLLGPVYQPKPVKSAEERIAEALNAHIRNHPGCTPPTSGFQTACEMARILRGEG